VYDTGRHPSTGNKHGGERTIVRSGIAPNLHAFPGRTNALLSRPPSCIAKNISYGPHSHFLAGRSFSLVIDP
jgi:hypothetical protein